MKYFIPHTDATTSQLISELTYEVARQTEENILSQLNDFISRGLLIVEGEMPILVHDFNSAQISLKHKVTLKLKDKEYIEYLEKQNKELNELVQTLRNQK